MAWQDTYKTLAEEIDATISDPVNTIEHINNCKTVLVDLESISDIEYEAATTLLPKMQLFYNYALDNWHIVLQRKILINLINKFTIRHFGDLTTFVSGVSWENGCVPHNWADISADIGYDTSEWVVCS